MDGCMYSFDCTCNFSATATLWEVAPRNVLHSLAPLRVFYPELGSYSFDFGAFMCFEVGLWKKHGHYKEDVVHL